MTDLTKKVNNVVDTLEQEQEQEAKTEEQKVEYNDKYWMNNIRALQDSFQKEIKSQTKILDVVIKEVESKDLDSVNLRNINTAKNVIDKGDDILGNFMEKLIEIENKIKNDFQQGKIPERWAGLFFQHTEALKEKIELEKEEIEKKRKALSKTLKYKLQEKFNEKKDYLLYQIEVGKLTPEQAKKEMYKYYNKLKKYVYIYTTEKNEKGKNIVKFIKPIGDFHTLFDNLRTELNKNFGIDVGKEKQKEEYYEKLSDNYAKAFGNKIQELEKKTGIVKYSDTEIGQTIKQDLQTLAGDLGFKDKGIGNNLQVLGDIRKNIIKNLDDFQVEEENMRHFLRMLPGSKLIIHLIINLKKWGARTFVDISLIALSFFAFVKQLMDFFYRYRAVMLVFLSLFLVIFTLNYAYKPAGSFFSMFVGFDYFYAPLTYAVFKAFFMIMFIFYLYYVFIDIVMELALGFNKAVGEKMKVLIVNIILLIVFSSLILG